MAGARQWHRRWPTDTGERAGSRLRWGTAHQPWAGPRRLNDTWSWADLLGGRAPRLVRSHSRSLTAHPLRACPVCGRVMTSSRTVPSTARHPAPRDTHAPRPTDQADDAHRACVRAPLGPARPRSDAAGAAACCSLSPPATSANAAVTVNVLGPKASEGSLSKTNANKNERNETWSATGSLPAVAAAPSLGRGLRATRLARGSRPGSSCTARTAACGADSGGVCSGLRGPGLSGCS